MFHLSNFCRLCLSFKGKFTNICDDNIMEMLVVCMPELEMFDSLPMLICSLCLDQLEMFYQFRNKCLKSEYTLNTYKNKFMLLNPSVRKFVTTELKVNLIKNYGKSKRLPGNVQISRKPRNRQVMPKHVDLEAITVNVDDENEYPNQDGIAECVSDSDSLLIISEDEIEVISDNKPRNKVKIHVDMDSHKLLRNSKKCHSVDNKSDKSQMEIGTNKDKMKNTNAENVNRLSYEYKNKVPSRSRLDTNGFKGFGNNRISSEPIAHAISTYSTIYEAKLVGTSCQTLSSLGLNLPHPCINDKPPEKYMKKDIDQVSDNKTLDISLPCNVPQLVHCENDRLSQIIQSAKERCTTVQAEYSAQPQNSEDSQCIPSPVKKRKSDDQEELDGDEWKDCSRQKDKLGQQQQRERRNKRKMTM